MCWGYAIEDTWSQVHPTKTFGKISQKIYANGRDSQTSVWMSITVNFVTIHSSNFTVKMRRTPRWGATSKLNDKYLPAWEVKKLKSWLKKKREMIWGKPRELVSYSFFSRCLTQSRYYGKILNYTFRVYCFASTRFSAMSIKKWLNDKTFEKKKKKKKIPQQRTLQKKQCNKMFYKEIKIKSWTCNLKNYILSGWIFFHTENVSLSSQQYRMCTGMSKLTWLAWTDSHDLWG